MLVVLGVLVGCQPALQDRCEPSIEPPEGLEVPAGSASDVLVRFFNPTARPVRITQLEFEPTEAFSFRLEANDFTIAPGRCGAPGEVGLLVRFAPPLPGRYQTKLKLRLDDAPVSVALGGVGTGPLPTVQSVVNFGLLSLSPSPVRRLEVRNVGSPGTTLEAEVTSVTATTPNTSEQELCIGQFSLGACSPATRVTVARAATFSLVVNPTSPGDKAWDVEVRAAADSFRVRVVAKVVSARTCQLEATPATLEFGAMLAPQSETRSTVVRNVGTSPCLVLGVSTTDPQFSLVDWPTTAGLLLDVGASLQVTVRASLRSARGAVGTLTFALASDGASQPGAFDVALDANPPASCLIVSPPILDFGVVSAGCLAPERLVTLANRCARTVLVSKLAVDSPFSLLAPGVQVPLALAPGETRSFTARFTPSSTAGNVSSVLRLALQDDIDVFFPLSVRVEPRPPQREVFAFDRRAVSDLVLVLDDSPSFARQHARTRVELDRLADVVARSITTLNARIAVTTTDVTSTGPRGRFRATDGGVRWASGDDPSFRATFGELTRLSTAGAEGQSCIEAATRALTGPLESDPQANAGFRRLSGVLSVLCVTDDIEHSANPALWRAQLQALDAGSRFSYSVIGPIDSTCPVDALDDGGTHAANVAPFSGLLGDICRPWPLRGPGSPPSRQTLFFLGSTPVPGTLTVALDAVDLPAMSNGRVNWRYDAASNAIRLEPDILGLDPPTLEVRYQPACP
ncbi:MAG: hypothetical protein MUC96_27930 [Myxococcaceae bacterium]|jgi:hypothetical protein|nr:hypothetical protein [Myxococcaceae bacterium]